MGTVAFLSTNSISGPQSAAKTKAAEVEFISKILETQIIKTKKIKSKYNTYQTYSIAEFEIFVLFQDCRASATPK